MSGWQEYDRSADGCRWAAVARTTAMLALSVFVAGCFGRGMYVREGLQSCAGCEAAIAELDQRVILIGDTGEYAEDTANFKALSRVAAEAPERTLIAFLGDNVYPRGLPAVPEDEAAAEALPLSLVEERDFAEEVLRIQVRAVERAGAEAVFIPGNHDWDKNGDDGLARVRAQGEFLAGFAQEPERVRMLPADGCPGPVVLERGDSVTVIVLDTVWLLRQDQPRQEHGCTWGPPDDPRPLEPADNNAVFEALFAAIEEAGDRQVVFASHHPFKTRGPHGGYFTLQEFIFPFTLLEESLFIPLPVLYPVVRWVIVRSNEDLIGSENEIMRRRIEEILARAERQPLVAAGGHEHSLQVFDDSEYPMLYLVSGAGSKTTPVGRTDDTLFKDRHLGFMVVDTFRDGRALLRVLEPDGEDEHAVVFSMWLREDEADSGQGRGPGG